MKVLDEQIAKNAVPYLGDWEKMLKKMEKHPLPVQMLMRRTLNTAMAVVASLHDIPFQKLESSLYFFCESLETKTFVHEYEGQLELAESDRDKFIKGLYPFFNRISSTIRKHNLYDDFFNLQYICNRHLETNKFDDQQRVVINSYIILLMETSEFIRPNKFDYNTILCGRKTTGELITIPDKFPLLDMPGYETLKIADPEQIEAIIVQRYHKYGYLSVHSMDDIDRLINMDRACSNNLIQMSRFINEYTFDILPEKPFSCDAKKLMSLITSIPLNLIENSLKKRKRTLPTNGYLVKFDDNPFFIEILFKEIYQDDAIFMLYRAKTTEGDFSGSYNTKRPYLYTVFNNYHGPQETSIKDGLKTLLLVLYATTVLNDPELTIDNIFRYFALAGKPLSVHSYGMGGKPRNLLEKSLPAAEAVRKGNEAYEETQAAVQGYIRKLPAGQHASENAISIALALGYDLEENETYVQPFIKHVFKLKSTEEN